MSSAFKSLMKRLFLSAAVKKMLVRLVSTLTISSESCGNSSRFRGVGDGDGFACVPLSFFADRVLPAIPPHKSRKTSRDKTMGRRISRYCISVSLLRYAVSDGFVTALRSHLQIVVPVSQFHVDLSERAIITLVRRVVRDEVLRAQLF